MSAPISKCDLNFGDAASTDMFLMLNASMAGYQNQKVNYGEELLKVNQSRLPFDISLESLKPFMHVDFAGWKISYAGIRIHLSRNNFGQLVGGYYGPTIIFSLLSLVSYSIKADIVSD